MDWVTDPQAWIALATLTMLEIVLGIDNIVFISILSDKVAVEERARARSLGLAMAMVTRIALLFSIVWVMRLTQPLITLMGHSMSGRDLILNLEQFVEVLVVAPGPEVRAVLCTDQLCGDSYAAAGSAHAPFDSVSRAQHAADSTQILVPASESRTGGAADDPNPRDFRQ